MLTERASDAVRDKGMLDAGYSVENMLKMMLSVDRLFSCSIPAYLCYRGIGGRYRPGETEHSLFPRFQETFEKAGLTQIIHLVKIADSNMGESALMVSQKFWNRFLRINSLQIKSRLTKREGQGDMSKTYSSIIASAVFDVQQAYISMVDMFVWVEVTYKEVEIFYTEFYGTRMLRRTSRKKINRNANTMNILVVLNLILVIAVNCTASVDKSGTRFGETFFTIDDYFGFSGHYIHNILLPVEGYLMVGMVSMVIYLSAEMRLQFTILGEYVQQYFNMDITKQEDRVYQERIFHGMKFVAGHYGTILRVRKLIMGVWKYMVLQIFGISGIFAFTYIIFIIASERFSAKLLAVPWYTWNFKNRQALLILLPNIVKTEVIGFGEIVHLNYALIKITSPHRALVE
nr:unnamed protein product [Callosobruchus chinensis]